MKERLVDGELHALGEALFSLPDPFYDEKAVRDETCSAETGRLEAEAILDYLQTPLLVIPLFILRRQKRAWTLL